MMIYVNGRYVAAERAKIPVQDRGFRFGDGVFETIAVYHGVPYQWELHMVRLKAGLQALAISAEVEHLLKVAKKLLAKNRLEEATLRIAISRGIGSIGYLPIGCADATIVMEAAPRDLPPLDNSNLYLSSYEKISLRALPMQYKLAQGLNSSLARMEAAQHGCLDALLLNAAGEICEASSANIFWRRDKILYTPALECGLLDGTTRAALFRLLPYRIEEGAFSLQAIKQAEAVIICNSHLQAMPVMELKPLECRWQQSMALAHEMRELLAKDIVQYVHSHRSS